MKEKIKLSELNKYLGDFYSLIELKLLLKKYNNNYFSILKTVFLELFTLYKPMLKNKNKKNYFYNLNYHILDYIKYFPRHSNGKIIYHTFPASFNKKKEVISYFGHLKVQVEDSFILKSKLTEETSKKILSLLLDDLKLLNNLKSFSSKSIDVLYYYYTLYFYLYSKKTRNLFTTDQREDKTLKHFDSSPLLDIIEDDSFSFNLQPILKLLKNFKLKTHCSLNINSIYLNYSVKDFYCNYLHHDSQKISYLFFNKNYKNKEKIEELAAQVALKEIIAFSNFKNKNADIISKIFMYKKKYQLLKRKLYLKKHSSFLQNFLKKKIEKIKTKTTYFENCYSDFSSKKLIKEILQEEKLQITLLTTHTIKKSFINFSINLLWLFSSNQNFKNLINK